MSTYRTLKGQLIKKVSADPTNPLEGQIWYNTTTGILKGLPAVTAWASAANMTNGRASLAGAGIQTAGMVFGGAGVSAKTEEYNGSEFSSGGDMDTARQALGGAGTQTAGLAFGGYDGTSYSALTEEYNGSSWTESGDLATARQYVAGAGTQTAGLAFGGRGSSGKTTSTEEYNGTSWTSGGALNTARAYLAGCGTQTSALAFGGSATATTGITEAYDGSSWTEVGDLNTSRLSLSGAGESSTSAIAFGGSPSNKNETELFNGTSWSETANLATGRAYLAGFGTASASVAASGGSNVVTAEEFNRSINVILDGAWASANNSNTLSEGPASFGTKAGIVSVGGYGPSGPSNAHSDAVEEYDGTNWTNATAYPTNVYAGQGAGTLTAGIISGGNSGGSTFINNSTTYNGSSWTAAPTLNNARGGTSSSLGTQTAALHVGGYDSSPPVGRDYTEEFNGSSWSEQTDMSTGRARGGTAGTQTAALYFCGETTNTGPIPSRIPNTTEEYNGTSWTAGGTVPARFTRLNGSGTQNNAYRIGGSTGSAVVATTDFYNGTSWASSDNLLSAQNFANSGGSGFSDSIIARGRGSSTYTAVTQEYSRPSGTKTNVKTITSSTS